jgi:acyl carrier protein
VKREEVYQKLKVIFRNNFDDESIELSDGTSAEDIEDWDSLEQINLIVAIQDEFKIKFNIEEVNSMKDVGEMVNYILKKIGK